MGKVLSNGKANRPGKNYWKGLLESLVSNLISWSLEPEWHIRPRFLYFMMGPKMNISVTIFHVYHLYIKYLFIICLSTVNWSLLTSHFPFRKMHAMFSNQTKYTQLHLTASEFTSSLHRSHQHVHFKIDLREELDVHNKHSSYLSCEW